MDLLRTLASDADHCSVVSFRGLHGMRNGFDALSCIIRQGGRRKRCQEKKVSGTFFTLPRSPARPDCCFQAQPFDGVDLPRAIAAFKAAGFVHSHTFGINIFADGPPGQGPRGGADFLCW